MKGIVGFSMILVTCISFFAEVWEADSSVVQPRPQCSIPGACQPTGNKAPIIFLHVYWHIFLYSVVGKVSNCHTWVKVKMPLIENDSSKSHPVKHYLSKSIKVFGFKYTSVLKKNSNSLYSTNQTAQFSCIFNWLHIIYKEKHLCLVSPPGQRQ